MGRFINIFILTILLFNAGRSGGAYIESIPRDAHKNYVSLKIPQKQSNNSESTTLKSLNNFEEEIETDKLVFSDFPQITENNIQNVGAQLHSVSKVTTISEILFEADSSPPLFC